MSSKCSPSPTTPPSCTYLIPAVIQLVCVVLVPAVITLYWQCQELRSVFDKKRETVLTAPDLVWTPGLGRSAYCRQSSPGHSSPRLQFINRPAECPGVQGGHCQHQGNTDPSVWQPEWQHPDRTEARVPACQHLQCQLQQWQHPPVCGQWSWHHSHLLYMSGNINNF